MESSDSFELTESMEGKTEKVEEEVVVVQSKAIPEDLVERIVSMVPFPSVFKARALSKSWLAKMSPVKRTSTAPDVRKAERDSFHRQLGDWSKTHWQTFCPVFLGKENFIAYDGKSHNWRRMPSLTHLPENLVLARSNLQIEGPLLYGFARPETRTRKKELYVANILTRSWKQLPPRPSAKMSVVLCNKLVVTSSKSESCSLDSMEEERESSSSSYKVVTVCREHRNDQFDRYSAQIYDSNLDAWNSKKIIISTDFFRLTTSAYFDGILYMVADANPRDLLAFSVHDGRFEELKMPFVDTMRIISVNLVVSNGSLLMIVTEGFHQQNQQVLRIDLEARKMMEVARGPPPHLNFGPISTQAVSDGNCIFFGVEESSANRVLAYNVHEKEWSCFPAPQAASVGPYPAANDRIAATTASDRKYKWSASSFQPGLSPFASV
ncbi:unnamed protein product [Calypogeia fissa]